MFRNPRAFVATFQNADPDVITKVIDMVNDLINVGLAEKQKAIDDHAAAVIVAADAASALAIAKDDLIFKKGELHIATDEVNEATAIDNLKAGEEAIALINLNTANNDLAAKQNFLAKETTRIDGEKAVLEQVVDILVGLQEGDSRRLLSSPSAFLTILANQGLQVDPDALNAVLDSVNTLIAEGEALRAAANDAVSDATAFQAVKSSEYDASIAAHVSSTETLEAAVAEQEMYQGVVNEATDVHNAATETKNAADASEASLDAFRISEIERVDSETADFQEVKKLLEDLL